MNTKKIFSILLVTICVLLGSKILAQPYEVPVKTGVNTDKNIVYIGVDKNRIVNEADSRQQKNYAVTTPDESRYKIDIENWVEPQEPTRALSPRHEDIEFGRGMGVDKDIIQQYDAGGNGATDARGVHYIRQDTNL